MNLYEKTEASKLADKERRQRRKLRITQVRMQSDNWMSAARTRFEKEKLRQLERIVDEVTDEVVLQAVKNVEQVTSEHDLIMKEIGMAHRNAANRPDNRKRNELKRAENEARAQERHVQALRKQRSERKEKKENDSRLIQIRDRIRVQEDCKAKCLVDRRPFQPKNVNIKSESLRDKLRREGYQQSIAHSLYVPAKPGADGKSSKLKKRPRTRTVRPKRVVSKKPTYHRPSPPKVEGGAFGSVANDHRRGLRTKKLRSRSKSPRGTGDEPEYKRRSRVKKSPDVLFMDATIPLPPQKYKAPAGLAIREPHERSRPSAWESAVKFNKETAKKNRVASAERTENARKAKVRGAAALKVARLEQRYKQLASSLGNKEGLSEPRERAPSTAEGESDEEVTYLLDPSVTVSTGGPEGQMQRAGTTIEAPVRKSHLKHNEEKAARATPEAPAHKAPLKHKRKKQKAVIPERSVHKSPVTHKRNEQPPPSAPVPHSSESDKAYGLYFPPEPNSTEIGTVTDGPLLPQPVPDKRYALPKEKGIQLLRLTVKESALPPIAKSKKTKDRSVQVSKLVPRAAQAPEGVSDEELALLDPSETASRAQVPDARTGTNQKAVTPKAPKIRKSKPATTEALVQKSPAVKHMRSRQPPPPLPLPAGSKSEKAYALYTPPEPSSSEEIVRRSQPKPEERTSEPKPRAPSTPERDSDEKLSNPLDPSETASTPRLKVKTEKAGVPERSVDSAPTKYKRSEQSPPSAPVPDSSKSEQADGLYSPPEPSSSDEIVRRAQPKPDERTTEPKPRAPSTPEGESDVELANLRDPSDTASTARVKGKKQKAATATPEVQLHKSPVKHKVQNEKAAPATPELPKSSVKHKRKKHKAVVPVRSVYKSPVKQKRRKPPPPSARVSDTSKSEKSFTLYSPPVGSSSDEIVRRAQPKPSKAIRHYIKRLLAMRPESLEKLKLTYSETSMSEDQNSVVIVNSSVAASLVLSNNSSEGISDRSTPVRKSPPQKSRPKKSPNGRSPHSITLTSVEESYVEESSSNSTGKSLPSDISGSTIASINVVYSNPGRPTTSDQQGRRTDSDQSLAGVLAALCARQEECLSISVQGGDVSTPREGSLDESIPPLSPFLERMMAAGRPGPSGAQRTPPSTPNSSFQKISPSSDSGSLGSKETKRSGGSSVLNGNWICSPNPSIIQRSQIQDEPIPSMIGTLASQWASISIERPPWLEA